MNSSSSHSNEMKFIFNTFHLNCVSFIFMPSTYWLCAEWTGKKNQKQNVISEQRQVDFHFPSKNIGFSFWPSKKAKKNPLKRKKKPNVASYQRDKIPWTMFVIMMMLKYRCHQSSSNLVLLWCAWILGKMVISEPKEKRSTTTTKTNFLVHIAF